MTTFSEISLDELFPDSDGKPMADNTEQFNWIVLIKENLEILFADRDDVFVAGDLLWYPVASQLIAPTAPDAMVIFGRPKGRRGSYRQWLEDNIPPQAVFEILSPKNTRAEMNRKREFYERYGVEEYYLYNPDRLKLEGWIRRDNVLSPIGHMDGWVSPRLGIKFRFQDSVFTLYHPDGKRFVSPIELSQQIEQERSRAGQAQLQAEQARSRADALAAKLLELGINPEELG